MAQEQVESTDIGSPFLYKTVEDLVMVKSTKFWKNSYVRVLGKVCQCEMGDNKVITLESPLQSSFVVKIILNVELLNCDLPRGRLLEIFGYLEALPRQDPILTVLFHRNVSGVSIPSYYRAMCLRSKYVPQFNDEADEMPLSPEQCSEKNDENPLSPAQSSEKNDEIFLSLQVSNASPSQE